MGNIGSRLTEIRKKNGLTQEQLSEMLDVSRQSVHKWENGSVLPNMDNIERLCEVFHVSSDYFIRGKTGEDTAALPMGEGPKSRKRAICTAFLCICAVCLLASLIFVAVESNLFILSIAQEKGMQVQINLYIANSHLFAVLVTLLCVSAVGIVCTAVALRKIQKANKDIRVCK